MTETITVVCHHMPSFNVDALTLEPIGCSYNGPAAITEPGGRQMSYGEWCIQGDAIRIEKVRAIQIEGAEAELRAIQAKIAELKNATSAEQGITMTDIEKDAARYRALRAALLSGGPEWDKLSAMLNIAPDTPIGVDDAVDATFDLGDSND